MGALAAAVLALSMLPIGGSTWDGTNPFNCTVQDAGLNATGPAPAADPYCVRFDKTHQSITDLGSVDFLLKEPARTATAVPKCFYDQEDHWRASITPGGPAIYEFTGHYFFDKAHSDGGVWITNLSLLGHPIPLPRGSFGVRTHDDIQADPRCPR